MSLGITVEGSYDLEGFRIPDVKSPGHREGLLAADHENPGKEKQRQLEDRRRHGRRPHPPKWVGRAFGYSSGNLRTSFSAMISRPIQIAC